MRTVVVGVANLQTTAPSPLGDNTALRFAPGEIDIAVSGVGFNVASALGAYGHDVTLICPLGLDVVGATVRAAIAETTLRLVAIAAARTPRSLVLRAPNGDHQIATDLAGLDRWRPDRAAVADAFADADLVVLGTLDACRPLVAVASEAGTRVAVDLQQVTGPDATNRVDFLAADILSMSHTHLAAPPDVALRQFAAVTDAEVVLITAGAAGSWAFDRSTDDVVRTPADPVVGVPRDTVGAGDAHFAAFLHAYVGAEQSIESAARFAAGHAARHLSRGA